MDSQQGNGQGKKLSNLKSLLAILHLQVLLLDLDHVRGSRSVPKVFDQFSDRIVLALSFSFDLALFRPTFGISVSGYGRGGVEERDQGWSLQKCMFLTSRKRERREREGGKE